MYIFLLPLWKPIRRKIETRLQVEIFVILWSPRRSLLGYEAHLYINVYNWIIVKPSSIYFIFRAEQSLKTYRGESRGVKISSDWLYFSFFSSNKQWNICIQIYTIESQQCIHFSSTLKPCTEENRLQVETFITLWSPRRYL